MASVTLKIEVSDWLLKAAKQNFVLRRELEVAVGKELVKEGMKKGPK